MAITIFCGINVTAILQLGHNFRNRIGRVCTETPLQCEAGPQIQAPQVQVCDDLTGSESLVHTTWSPRGHWCRIQGTRAMHSNHAPRKRYGHDTAGVSLRMFWPVQTRDMDTPLSQGNAEDADEDQRACFKCTKPYNIGDNVQRLGVREPGLVNAHASCPSDRRLERWVGSEGSLEVPRQRREPWISAMPSGVNRRPKFSRCMGPQPEPREDHKIKQVSICLKMWDFCSSVMLRTPDKLRPRRVCRDGASRWGFRHFVVT